MCESIGHHPFGAAALLLPLTTVTTYFGKAQVPLSNAFMTISLSDLKSALKPDLI